MPKSTEEDDKKKMFLLGSYMHSARYNKCIDIVYIHVPVCIAKYSYIFVYS